MNGKIFDIMKYSTHDGPGIRTTVFFKGCPLNCWWCHNPESQSIQQETMLRLERCISCGECSSGLPYICPTGARTSVGNEMTVKQIMDEIKKDIIFYDESGGGVTFSGGEPLMQHAVLFQLLKACKAEEIHTAIETTGFAPFDIIQKIAKYTDLFLYDIKLIDDQKHIKFTGVSNNNILQNLQQLLQIHSSIIVRVPIIPQVNDEEKDIADLAEYLTSLKNIKEVHLLPYHNIGVEKYKRLSREYLLEAIKPPEEQKMQHIADYLKRFGFYVKIGG